MLERRLYNKVQELALTSIVPNWELFQKEREYMEETRNLGIGLFGAAALTTLASIVETGRLSLGHAILPILSAGSLANARRLRKKSYRILEETSQGRTIVQRALAPQQSS